MSLKLGATGDKRVSLFQLFVKSIPSNWDGSSTCSTTCVIGRGVDCAIRIAYDEGESKLYKLISKKHAELVLTSTGVLIRDAHSKNGTFVNGERLMENESKQLYNGDTIMLGCPPKVREVRGAEALRINPYELNLTDMVSGYKDKIAERLEDLRIKKARQSGQPLSWNAIKRGFGMMGGDEVHVQRDAKRDRRKDVIDLTGADDDDGGGGPQKALERPPDPVVKKQENNEFNAELCYEQGCVYVLERPIYVIPNLPERFGRLSLRLKYIPAEYLKSPANGGVRMIRLGKIRRVLNRNGPPEFEDALKRWYSHDYYPEKFMNVQNAYQEIEASNMCYLGEPGSFRRHARHLACPAVTIPGCNHKVCARCFLLWLEDERGRLGPNAKRYSSPCCSQNMTHRPEVDRYLTEQICTMLEQLGVWDDFSSITFEGGVTVEYLFERTKAVLSLHFRNMAQTDVPSTQHAVQPVLAPGKLCGLGGRLKFGVESAQGVCSKCSKGFQPNDGMAFAIFTSRGGLQSTKSLYHMNCVQDGLKMRALTEGIQGYSDMDEAARHRALAEMF